MTTRKAATDFTKTAAKTWTYPKRSKFQTKCPTCRRTILIGDVISPRRDVWVQRVRPARAAQVQRADGHEGGTKLTSPERQHYLAQRYSPCRPCGRTIQPGEPIDLVHGKWLCIPCANDANADVPDNVVSLERYRKVAAS